MFEPFEYPKASWLPEEVSTMWRNDGVWFGCRRCSEDGSRCAVCWESYGYGLTSNGTCVMCDAPTTEDGPVCSSCNGDDPSFCLDCSLNIEDYNQFLWYADAQGQCLQCETEVEGCYTCEPLTGVCNSCRSGGGIVNGTCIPACADENCYRCNGDADTCNEGSCAFDHFLNTTTGRCQPCPPGCLKCDDGTGRCQACAGHPVPQGEAGECVPCSDPKCDRCIVSPHLCESCRQDVGPGNLYLALGVDLQTGRCVPCQKGCDGCWYDSSTCSSCSQGWLWSEAQQECTPCPGGECLSPPLP